MRYVEGGSESKPNKSSKSAKRFKKAHTSPSFPQFPRTHNDAKEKTSASWLGILPMGVEEKLYLKQQY